MTRRIKLEAGERGILDSYERGEWQSIGVLDCCVLGFSR